MKMKKEIGVYIESFQPMDKLDEKKIKEGLEDFPHLIIIVDDINKRVSIERPISFEMIKEWIMEIVGDDLERVTIAPMRSYLNSKNSWIKIEEILFSVSRVEESKYVFIKNRHIEAKKIKISLPYTEIIEYKEDKEYIQKKEILEKWFRHMDFIEDVPHGVLKSLVNARITPYAKRYNFEENFSYFLDELDFYTKEKELFSKYPFPETLKFYCADPVVIYRSHILLIKRGAAPGKNSWALPGGFVNSDESAKEAMIRELKEETGLNISEDEIYKNKVFDNPNRNIGIPRISNAFLVKLSEKREEFPEVVGMDDAIEAEWIPLSKIKDMRLFDDHVDIIDSFTRIY